jgi:hypothetical protein
VFDSSPEFKELAKTIICTGYPFAYSHNASDEELDELTYSWAEPLGDNFSYIPANPSATALTFAPSPPYSVTYPIPGSPTLDPKTGEIAYDSDTAGVFVTCIKVEAEKCGQLVAEIYREVQVMLLDCNIYNPPIDGLNDPPIITAPVSPLIWDVTWNNGLPSYSTTVYAGDLITFNIEASDADLYAPAPGTPQDVTLDVSGGQFSADYTNPLLCANPPCAIFNNGGTPPLPPPFSAPTLVSGMFEWQTSCPHVNFNVCANSNSISHDFTFVIKAFDDFCPANGISISTIKITVVPPVPDLRCTEVLENGDVILTWKYVDGAPPTQEPYLVWHSSSPNGPFVLIDSVFHPETTFTYSGTSANDAPQYFYLSTEEGCGIASGDLNSGL